MLYSTERYLVVENVNVRQCHLTIEKRFID